MGILSKFIGAIVYTIKTPFTNGLNAYRYGVPIAALIAMDYHMLQGRFMDAVVAYASIRYFPPTSLADVALIGLIIIGAAVLMGGKYFVGMIFRDL